jgi:hypothetical protein
LIDISYACLCDLSSTFRVGLSFSWTREAICMTLVTFLFASVNLKFSSELNVYYLLLDVYVVRCGYIDRLGMCIIRAIDYTSLLTLRVWRGSDSDSECSCWIDTNWRPGETSNSRKRVLEKVYGEWMGSVWYTAHSLMSHASEAALQRWPTSTNGIKSRTSWFEQTASRCYGL